MIEILTKIRAKIIIIVVKNRENYCFIIIFKCKQVPLSLFSDQKLASTFGYEERSRYYKVYAQNTPFQPFDPLFFNHSVKFSLGCASQSFLDFVNDLITFEEPVSQVVL